MRIIGIAAFVSFALVLQSGAFAGETGVQQLVKRCEAASKVHGTSPALCSCTLERMQEYGFTDAEIVNFSRRDFKPKNLHETERHMDYSIKIRLIAGQCG